jgi:uncharacterized protein (DUF302 family)
MEYGHRREVDLSFDEAVQRVTEELAKDGFGVLTTIDVQATLKKKLDKDVRPYVILGACNPPFAAQALAAEPDIGLLLPCNAVVYENEQGRTVVGVVDARKMLSIVGRTDLAPIAGQVDARLQAVLERV